MEDARVREDLALASFFSGMCLANSGLGAVHGLAAAAGARLSAPHGAVCDQGLHRRFAPTGEVATLLTGRPDASPEDAIAWLQELTAALSIPGLASYGLNQAEIEPVVTAAQRASSMRGNPIVLSDEEVSEIVTRSL